MKFYAGDRLASAFSIWRVVAGIFLALGYVLLEYIATVPMMAISQALLIVGLGSIAALELFVSNSDDTRPQESSPAFPTASSSPFNDPT